MLNGPRPCSVCDLPLHAAWLFREDDRHCALCGERILHLVAHPTAPDGAVWLYPDPLRGYLVRLTWERGVDRCPQRRRTLRTVVDVARCAAHFRGEGTGTLDCGFVALPGGSTLTLQLLSLFGWPEGLNFPPAGAVGELTLATAAGLERLPARLLPPPCDPILHCPDPSVTRDEDVWLAYPQGGVAVIPLELTAPVAQWLLSASDNVEPGAPPGVSLEGLAGPTLLEPGRPLALRLRVEGHEAHPTRTLPFTFLLERAALEPWTLRGAIILLPGSQLLFEGGSSRTVAVRLGHRATRTIQVTAVDSGYSPPLGSRIAPALFADVPQVAFDDEVLELEDVAPDPPWDLRGEGVSIVECAAETEPGEAGWLRVVAPRPESLPWTLPPGVSAGIDVEVDATRLDREHYDGADLCGAVVLTDSRGRRWRCAVRATVSRPPPLPEWVAIDWGTTNTCAAYRRGVRPGDTPVSLSFDEEQARAPESFPSDLYFEDLSDPLRPVFLVGHEAARRARERPECCLRSVKRAFRSRERLFVMDEHGRGHTYTTAEVAHLLLRRLVDLAEAALGQEIHRLGLSHPTGWPAAARRRLETVASELEAGLQRERRPFRVTVLPPAIDEANAVALDFITSEHGRADLPETFHLVAYDFGGGTIDTSVLEVYLPQDLAGVRTRYVGLGGRGDFGGDDVTRAVMACLRDRVVAASPCARVEVDGLGDVMVRLLAIPLVADGEAAPGPDAARWHAVGRRNWDALWHVAERLKMHLCGEPAPADAPSAEAGGEADFGESLAMDVEDEERRRHAAGADPTLRDLLQPQLDRILCRVLVEPVPRGAAAHEAVWSLAALLDSLPDAAARDDFFRGLDVTLEEVCDYPLQAVGHTEGERTFTVRQRVEETVLEIQAQCDARGVSPDVIVLAGGGCRLPLVTRLFREHFPSDRELIHFRGDRAKRRVAFGLASYLALRESLDLDCGLARSTDVTHRALGVRRTRVERRVARVEFEAVAPVGTLLCGAEPHPFRLLGSQLLPGAGAGRCLPLWAQDGRNGERAVGHFELNGLPLAAGDTCDAELRLRGPGRVELTVTHEGRAYGPFALMTTNGDLEMLLQSADGP